MEITNKEIEKLQNDIKRLTQEYQKEKIKYDSQIQFKSYRQNKRHYESTSSDTSHHSEEPKLERTQSFKEKPRKIILLQPSKLDVALNPTITQKLELGNSNVNNLDIHKKQLKNQERYLKNTEKIIETLQILQPHENCEQKTAVSQLVKHLSNEVENQKDEIKYEKQRIEQTDKMAKHFGAFLEIPDIYNISEDNEATKSILEHRNIKSGCHTFNVDINANQNFKDFWDTVLIYTKGFKLSQDSYIRILNTLIQGSASRTFCELVKDNKSLHEILNTLNELFSVRRTVVDDMKDLNNFKRLPNEDIKKTMQKAKVAVERIQHLWDPVLWQQGRKTEILKSVLRQVITTKTRQRLDAEEMKYLKTGTCLSYDAIIEFIDTYENTHNQIPTKEMTMKINVCTGAPKDTQELEEQNETEIKINEISTLINNIPINSRTKHAIDTIRKEINSVNLNEGEPSKKRRFDPSLIKNDDDNSPNTHKYKAMENHKMEPLQYNKKQEPQLVTKRGNIYSNLTDKNDLNDNVNYNRNTQNDIHKHKPQHDRYSQNRQYDHEYYNNNRYNNQQATNYPKYQNRPYNGNRNYNQNYRGNYRQNNNYNNRGHYPRRGYNQNYYNRNYNNRGNRHYNRPYLPREEYLKMKREQYEQDNINIDKTTYAKCKQCQSLHAINTICPISGKKIIFEKHNIFKLSPLYPNLPTRNEQIRHPLNIQTENNYNTEYIKYTDTVDEDGPVLQPGTSKRLPVTNFNPVVPYANLTVTTLENFGPIWMGGGTEVRALVDTGCSKTCINKRFYEHLMTQYNQGRNDITESYNETVLTCDRRQIPIHGTTRLRLWLAKDVYRDISALVINDLSDPMILGYDFLHSDYVKYMSKSHLVLRNKPQRNDIKIPLIKVYSEQYICHSNKRNTQKTVKGTFISLLPSKQTKLYNVTNKKQKQPQTNQKENSKNISSNYDKRNETRKKNYGNNNIQQTRQQEQITTSNNNTKERSILTYNYFLNDNRATNILKENIEHQQLQDNIHNINNINNNNDTNERIYKT